MKGPRLLWEPALHSGTPSHGNVSKSQFDPVSSVCSHSQFPPPAPWTAVCCSQPEVCGVPAAPEAGTPLQHFPWIHSQQTQASPPTSHGCLPLRHPLTPDTNAAEGQSAGLPSPHLSNRLKGVSNQRFKVRNRYTAWLLSPTPPSSNCSCSLVKSCH